MRSHSLSFSLRMTNRLSPMRTFLLGVACITTLAFTLGCDGDEDEVDVTGCMDPSEVVFPAATSTVAAGSTKVVAAEGIYTGVYVIGDARASFANFVEISGGTSPAIYFTFHDWSVSKDADGEPILQGFDSRMEGEVDEPTPLEFARELADSGTVMAIAWSSVGYFFEDASYWLGNDTRIITFADMMAGRYDDYIRTSAQQIREFALPIMISPFAEMNPTAVFSYGENGYTDAEAVDHLCNNYGDPAHPDGPERLRDAYIHIVDIFREENVQNVTWFMYAATNYQNEAVYSANVDLHQYDHPAFYYPGDDYVDWIGSSIYFVDQDSTLANDELGDFDFAALASLAAWREITDKPFYSPEFGIAGNGTDSRSPIMAPVFQGGLEAAGVKAFTLPHSEVFAQFFSLPKLGNNADEDALWQNDVMGGEAYANDIVTATSE